MVTHLRGAFFCTRPVAAGVIRAITVGTAIGLSAGQHVVHSGIACPPSFVEKLPTFANYREARREHSRK